MQVTKQANGQTYAETLAYLEVLQPDDAAYDAMIKDIMPMAQDQRPQDIADAVAFLSSSRASQITGEVIRIDGGLTL